LVGASGCAYTVGLLGGPAGTVVMVGKEVVTDCPSLTLL